MQWILVALIVSLIVVGLVACKSDNKTTFGKEAFAASRPCPEIRFDCLPEAHDDEWSTRFAEFELTNRRDFTADDHKVMAEVRVRAFMDEIIAYIEKQFPDFWQGVDEKTRSAWVDAALDKCDEYGFNTSRAKAMMFVDILARLGLDFDKREENSTILKFIRDRNLASSIRLSESCDYVDWVLLGRKYDSAGNQISLWGMRNILAVMPWPDPEPPELPRRKGM